MARQISPQRRRIVAFAGALAAMGCIVPTLSRKHPHFAAAILIFMVLALVYLIRETLKVRHAGNCR